MKNIFYGIGEWLGNLLFPSSYPSKTTSHDRFAEIHADCLQRQSVVEWLDTEYVAKRLTKYEYERRLLDIDDSRIDCLALLYSASRQRIREMIAYDGALISFARGRTILIPAAPPMPQRRCPTYEPS